VLPRRQPLAPPDASTDRLDADRPHRHAGDLVRVALGAGVLGIGFLIAQRGEISLLERDLFRLVNDLPALVLLAVWVVMQLGNVVAVPVLAAVAAAARRFRLARDLVLSGGLAYLAADLVKSIVQRERPIGLPVGDVLNEQVTGLGFISGHAAVAAALATAAAPYLARRPRRVLWALAWTVGLARIYIGAHLPLDVVGGIGTGWAIGSLVHWLLGVPRWSPTVGRVAALLDRFGLPVRGLRPADVSARSSHPFTGRLDDGRGVFIKVLDPDRYERDWLFRAARWVAVRDVKDADAMAPLGQQAEHEAVAAMTARDRGVRAPAVLLARGTGRGALVVQEELPGRSLDQLSADDLTPDLLSRVWDQVALLHRARIAHHDLVASSVLVDPTGQPWLVDFGNAQTGATDDALAGDVAELLASLTVTAADVSTVVVAAVRQLGPHTVTAALPALARLSLSAATRATLRGRDTRLAELRTQVRAELGLPQPDRPGTLRAGLAGRLAAASSAVVLFAGLSVVAGAGVFESVERDGWRWLGAAVVFAALGRAAMAAAVMVSVPRRIALGRAIGATASTDCASVLRGRPGGRQVAARFLEEAGVLPGAAQRATVRAALGAVLGAVLVAVVALVLALTGNRLSHWQAPVSSVPVLLVGVGALSLVVLAQLLTRRRFSVPPSLLGGGLADDHSAAPTVRWLALVGWSALGTALEGGALAAALHAVGADVPLLASSAAYAVLRLVWTLVPELALPGAGEVALLLAMTALGAPLADACAAVLFYRALAFWLPVGIGALVLRSAQRHGGT